MSGNSANHEPEWLVVAGPCAGTVGTCVRTYGSDMVLKVRDAWPDQYAKVSRVHCRDHFEAGDRVIVQGLEGRILGIWQDQISVSHEADGDRPAAVAFVPRRLVRWA